jgi:soluble lytic murein transglycosylase
MTACSTVSTPEPATPTPIPTVVDTPTPTPEPTDTPTPVFSSNPYNDGMTARRNGDYARAIAAFQLVLNSKPAADLAQESQYRLGEAYWLNNEDAKSITTWNAYLQANPQGAHVPEVRYLLADAYRVLKDYPNALEQLRLYRALTTTLAGDVDGMIADVMVLAGDSDNAIKQYDLALKDATLSISTRISILMRVADLYLGLKQPGLAATRYDAANQAAGDARTKADALNRAGEAYASAGKNDTAIERWTEAFTKYPEQPAGYQALVYLVNRNVTVDEFLRGYSDFNSAQYDAAIAAFQRYLDKNGTRAGDARYYLALSYVRKGLYAQAITEYDNLIKKLPKDKRVTDAYLGKASTQGLQGKIDDAVATYRKFATTFPDDALADDALWRAALLLDRANRTADATKLYEETQEKFPARERADDSLFWAGMNYYIGKDYKTASTRWLKIAKEYTKGDFYARALLWLGKVSKTQGQADAAKTYWTQAAGLSSSYYTWRANDLLNPPKATNDTRLYDTSRYVMGNEIDYADFEKWLATWSKGATPLNALDTDTKNDVHFKRGVELLRLDRTVDARREFATIIANNQDDARELYALALYFRDNNLYSLSMECGEKIAKLAASANASDAPRLLWMLRYPTYYSDLVLKESQANQVDPMLYFGLIRQESSFNPWSTSSADARGLGQVMPATGRGIAERLKVKNFTLDQLYLPYVSIRFGVWYFAQDLKTFTEPIYALAAYNAGSGRVKNWQRSDLDLAVEEIDITETASYVRIVYSNWRQYQVIYK